MTGIAPPEPPDAASPPRTRWGQHAALLAVGAFAVGTDAFVIAGVLPEIAHSLDVGIGAAGQLVTVFSIAYALLAPFLGAATAGWSRRTVLVLALVLFAVGNAVTALAPDYTLVLLSRVVAAAGAALYTASASATAAALAGERHRGRAIAIVMMGLTSSLVLGAPLGTAIGALLGWRATMWFVVAVAVVIVPVIALRLPDVWNAAVGGLRGRLAPLADRRVLNVLLTTLVAFTGIYVPYTYISAVYAPAVAGHDSGMALLLLVFGLAATVGNLAAGYLADRLGPVRVIVGGTLVLAAVLLVVPAGRTALVVALPVVALSGIFSFSVTTPQQHQIIALAPNAASLVTALYQSALYLAVSLSGVVGAAGLRVAGAEWLPVLAAVLVLGASGLAWWSGRWAGPDTEREAARRQVTERLSSSNM